jgi:hypothetical protein
MAENTTIYTTIIEAEVTGGDSVKKLGEDTEETEKKVGSLKSQIRETVVAMQKLEAEGNTLGKDFQDLRAKLDDLNDAQDRVNFKSGQLDDQLSALPGPIGQAGSAFKAFNDSINQFGKTLTISLGIVGLLVAAFFAIKDALSKTEEGTALLSQATTALNKVMAPFFALLEAVGTAVLPILIKGLDALGSVINKVAGFFGVKASKINEVTKSLEKNNEYANKIAEEEKKRADAAKALADKAQAEKEKRDAAAKAKREKAEAERKKREEERQKQLEAGQKVQIENYLSTLEARDKELYIRGQKLQEDLITLEKAGFKDKTGALEAFRIEEAAINKKYDDEAQKKIDEEKKKKDEEAKAKAEEDKKIAEEKLKAESQARADKGLLLQAEFNLDRANNEATFQDELDLFDRTRQLGKEELEAQKASADAITAYEKETAAARIQLERAQQAVKLSIIADALGSVADLVGKDTAAGKALAIGQAIINTYLGATAALAASPPPFNFIAAGATIAAGLVNVKKILETPLPGVPAGSGGGSRGSVTLPTAPSLPQINAPQIGGTQPATPGAQIASTLAGATDKPIKAYVVSGDVSSAQALDRRTSKAATF